MRKIFLIIVLIFSFSIAARSQYIDIPDVNFKDFLMTNYPSCFNGAGLMDTTCSDIINATVLSVSVPVNNWEGFQYFRNLQELNISQFEDILPPVLPASLLKFHLTNGSGAMGMPALPLNLQELYIENTTAILSIPPLPASLTSLTCYHTIELVNLPVLPPALTYFECNFNFNVVSLPALPNSIVKLICRNNQNLLLSSLPNIPTSIQYLDCSAGNISFLQSLPASLDTLICSYTSIAQLPALPNGMRYLDASNSLLTALPTLPDSLHMLSVKANQLTSLPALPAYLYTADISQNNITTLPALPNAMYSLNAEQNQLSAMGALSDSLLFLDVNYNQLSSIPDLPAKLRELYCNNNNLTSLPALPGTLYNLYCDSNQLTTLPALPAILGALFCSFNQLTILPALPDHLGVIYCNNNQLANVTVLPNTLSTAVFSNNLLNSFPDLPASNSLQYLDISHNNISCFPTVTNLSSTTTMSVVMDSIIRCIPRHFNYEITIADANPAIAYTPLNNPYPLCNVINNVSHCPSFPVMNGYVFHDNNNNGIKDANESYRPNVRVDLSNNTFTFSNENGYYELAADSLGDYTVSCLPPYFYTVNPPDYSFHFSTYDNTVTNNFAMQPTTSIDSLVIHITPLTSALRMGREVTYNISYENAGTTNLTPVIEMNFNNTQLTYQSCSNLAVVLNGSQLQLTDSLMVPADRRYFTVTMLVNTNLNLGDTVFVNSYIIANGATATDATANIITGPFDPNDKQATPVLSPAEVSNGKYIDYKVRFQNTGTDTAFNIVITDTLSTYLDGNSFELLEASHPCKATVNGNNVSFEFINIALPDSNVNEVKSHGFVVFKVKPRNAVTAGTDIPNQVAIYFDYNQPVITNTAITQIRNPQSASLQLISFTGKIVSTSAANIYWTTANESALKNFDLEMSSDGNTFNSIAIENSKGNIYNSYIKNVTIPQDGGLYFRLKINKLDGTFFYSQVLVLREIISAGNNTYVIQGNPVKSILSISIKDATLKNTWVKIINTQGAVVKKFLIKNDIENINVSDLSNGTYFFKTVKGSSRFVIIR